MVINLKLKMMRPGRLSARTKPADYLQFNVSFRGKIDFGRVNKDGVDMRLVDKVLLENGNPI